MFESWESQYIFQTIKFLGGGFIFLFSPLPGEMIQLD